MEHLLEVKNLKVEFHTYAGIVHAVRGVSFHLDRGETLAIVGESGCGKSVSAQALMGLIPTPPGRITSGWIQFRGRKIQAANEKELAKLRGSHIGMIFQDPMTSLNPTMTVGAQIEEVLARHTDLGRRERRERAVEMLATVGIPNPRRRHRQYPHQFSGGMRQRAMIATALACHPRLLIADEPTTALDVTIQAQILDLMRDLKERFGMSIILITHDLGVVAGLADRVVVMYAGKVVETGPTREIFYRPQHPYTRGLLAAVPRLDGAGGRRLAPIPGRPPDLVTPPPGCAFWPRCPYAMRICAAEEPQTSWLGEARTVSCWLMDPRAKQAGRMVG
ncbi:MAG: Oligopeptide/dipeptide ABC transporter, ATPase subunit [Clostridia bacterium 62_21]|nr:MAG: Oligopeptide/dipeptide ABC transporter, ATPase subunit [Clostridia bacterium 62_21]